ncbi:MAG: lantibiotic dehydratase [Chitinophagaceae bacterium]
MNQSAVAAWPFVFLEELVLRTPAIPFVNLVDEEKVNALVNDTDFLEAIYLGSPVLYAECIRLKNGTIQDVKEISKIRTSLIKYYQRMYSRCTPFGLFSGCSLVKWSNGSSGIIIPATRLLRNTRLDMHYLCALGQQLSSIPVIKERLLYYPNNSAYRIGDEVRYIEYRYKNGKRVHQISSVLHSEYLEAVLLKATAGITIDALKNLLVQQEAVEEEEALEFIDELIGSQVLINELDPAITGDEFIHQVLAVLRKINLPVNDDISALSKQLEFIVASLKEIDAQGHNSPEVYSSVIEKIKELNVPFEENKLFQVDMYNRPAANSIKEEWKNELEHTIQLLAKLFSAASNENLTSFAERFRKRYEDQEVPLLQVLDAETGIGYTEQSGANLSPLLENLALPAQKERETYDIKWSKTEQWLFDLLIKTGDAKEVVIDETMLADFPSDFSSFPPSLSVMFNVVEKGKIVFKGCSGSSAANLLGRFAHADENICDLVRKITREEQQVNENIVFAEIIHLPEDRVGNVLLHPAFREHEIPFLAQSSLPSAQQVPLQDITIRVQQDKHIRLFSKKLNREIIPRLSNAHNYSFGSLPVYHFLAEMQSQGLVNGMVFTWGSMARNFRCLPRVRCGNVILFETAWQLRKEDFEKIVTGKETISEFQNHWQLPRLLVLADGDNELLVDLESKESAATFIKTIKVREFITLKEFLKPCPQTVTDEQGKRYNNQFVAVLMNKQKVYTDAGFTIAGNQETGTEERSFLPGSEWLYYKIYCGTKTADEILAGPVQSLTEELLRHKLIDRWFFIRYYDPEFHLRIRFHLPNTAAIGKVMELFLRSMKQLEKEGLVWKVQTDTYQREMERYGSKLVEAAEELFFTDSKMKLQFLSLTEGDEREKFRWLWSLRGVDELLNAFDYSMDSKYELMQQLQLQFAKEFNANKSLFKQLNQQYNDSRKLIQLAMENPVSETNEIKPLLAIFEEFKAEQRRAAQKIIAIGDLSGKQAELNSLLGSYIHMNLNRLFLSEPRLHELVVYDILCSSYRSQIKRKTG